MKKVLSFILIIVMSLTMLVGCSSVSRAITDIKSDIGGGLERDIYIYTADGKLIDEFHGKIDIKSENSYIKFDFEGNRYIYYNCLVKTKGKIK